MACYWRRPLVGFVGVGLFFAAASHGQAQTVSHRLGQIELSVLGISATIDPLAPVVPKHTASGVRIVVRGGTNELSPAVIARLLGSDVHVEAEQVLPGGGVA